MQQSLHLSIQRKLKLKWVLEYGNIEEWCEMFHKYGDQKIIEVTDWSAQMSKRHKDFAKFS